MSRLPALPPTSPAGDTLEAGTIAVAKASQPSSGSAAPPPTAPAEVPRLTATTIQHLDNAIAVPIEGSDMSWENDGYTGLATPVSIHTGNHMTASQVNNSLYDARAVNFQQNNVLVAHDRTADVEAVAESRHRQELMKYEMSYSQRIARLELDMEARRLTIQSEAAAVGQRAAEVSSALRQSESRFQYGQHQLDQANLAGNHFRSEVVELKEALLKAENKNAVQQEEFQEQSRRAEAEARLRDEKHDNELKRLTMMVENMQKSRIIETDRPSFPSPTPVYASEAGARPDRDYQAFRSPTPVIKSEPGNLPKSPAPPQTNVGAAEHHPNHPEYYDMTAPPGLNKPPTGPPGPPGGDDGDDDDHDDRRRSKKDKKSKKKKKKRDSSSDSSSSSNAAIKLAKALKKLTKSKKSKKDNSDDEDGTDQDKNKPPKNKPKEAEKIVFPKFPLPEQYRNWRIRVREAVVAASAQPDLAFDWLSAVWDKDTTEETLRDPKGFVTLDAKVLSAITNILEGDFARQMDTLKEKEANANRLVRGRQILYKLHEFFATNALHGSVYDVEDLLSVSLNNENLVMFLRNWDTVLSGVQKSPDEAFLEPLFHRQVKKCKSLQHDINIYERAAEGSAQRSYKFLYDAANAHVNRKRLEKNRERIAKQTGNPTVPAPARVPKDYCFSFVKTGKCDKGDGCKFKHEVPQERGRSKGKGKSRGGRSQSPRSGSGGKVNQLCKFFKQGRCERGDNCRFQHRGKPSTPAASEASSGESKRDKSRRRREKKDKKGKKVRKTSRPLGLAPAVPRVAAAPKVARALEVLKVVGAQAKVHPAPPFLPPSAS